MELGGTNRSRASSEEEEERRIVREGKSNRSWEGRSGSLCSCQGAQGEPWEGSRRKRRARKPERRKGKRRRGNRQGQNKFTISGDNGKGDPPVPIPNTEVKPFRADGTWLDTARESRSSPDPIFLSSSMAEHSAVNRGVVGSSPTWGANTLLVL